MTGPEQASRALGYWRPELVVYGENGGDIIDPDGRPIQLPRTLEYDYKADPDGTLWQNRNGYWVCIHKREGGS